MAKMPALDRRADRQTDRHAEMHSTVCLSVCPQTKQAPQLMLTNPRDGTLEYNCVSRVALHLSRYYLNPGSARSLKCF